jgi:MinD superfamily P-loop ATPase
MKVAVASGKGGNGETLVFISFKGVSFIEGSIVAWPLDLRTDS